MTERAFCLPEDFGDEYAKAVCKVGAGAECCRYLTMGADGWSCAKRTSMRFAIEQRADEMRAKGDNCDGVYAPERPFTLLSDRFEHKAGTTVYHSKGYDYGLASDDTRHTGIPHVSVTLEPSGDYPSFTVPTADIAPAEVTA